MKHVKIAAGFSHIDYAFLGNQALAACDAGVDTLHAEVSDLYLMPDLPYMGGPRVVQDLRPHVSLPIELHCYIRECTEEFIDWNAAAGVNMIILPFEYFMGGAPLAYFIQRARNLGMKFGLMLNCVTPASFMEEAIYWVDRIHVVTHDINEPNRSWRKTQLPMIQELRAMIDEKKPSVELAVDGGINAGNLAPLVEAGVDMIAFSKPIFRNADGTPASREQIIANVAAIRQAIDAVAIPA